MLSKSNVLYEIFSLEKNGNNDWIISLLPHPLSIEVQSDCFSSRKDYRITWYQSFNRLLDSNRTSFLVIQFCDLSKRTLDIDCLRVCGLDYARISTNISNIEYTYRCSTFSHLTSDEKQGINMLDKKLRGNDIKSVIMDELGSEAIMSYNDFLVLRNGVCAITKYSFTPMPLIKDIYYNAPYTTVKWSDGTTTTVAATDGEDFNKELGLAMALSRKYYECSGNKYPRAAFKHAVNTAHDQTEKTAARKAYKNSRKLLKEATDLVETETSNGQHTDI